MSQEQTPHYHYPGHIKNYDTVSPGLVGGEIGFVMETLDDILYAGGGTVIQPHSASVSGGLFESHFSYQYFRGESYPGLTWPLESITLTVDHARYLGKTALRQSYAVKIDSSIHQVTTGPNRITTVYNLEEVAGIKKPYLGSIVRPNIEGDPNPSDERMTAYDCDRLFELLDQVAVAINNDKQDQALASHTRAA